MVVAARKCKVAWHSTAWIMCIPTKNAIRRIFIFAESSGGLLNYARMNSLQIRHENKFEFQYIPRLNAPFFAMEVRAVVYISYPRYLTFIFRNAFINILYQHIFYIFVMFLECEIWISFQNIFLHNWKRVYNECFVCHGFHMSCTRQM